MSNPTGGTAEPGQGVWSELVGQQRAVETLRRAVEGQSHAMSHAWLVTGPPGSGRSNAARAFAAALQCPRGGCGECTECRTSLSGAHPDVTLVRTEMLSIGVEEVRDLVRRADMSPTTGRHQVTVWVTARPTSTAVARSIPPSSTRSRRRERARSWTGSMRVPGSVSKRGRRVGSAGRRSRRLRPRTPRR